MQLMGGNRCCWQTMTGVDVQSAGQGSTSGGLPSQGRQVRFLCGITAAGLSMVSPVWHVLIEFGPGRRTSGPTPAHQSEPDARRSSRGNSHRPYRHRRIDIDATIEGVRLRAGQPLQRSQSLVGADVVGDCKARRPHGAAREGSRSIRTGHRYRSRPQQQGSGARKQRDARTERNPHIASRDCDSLQRFSRWWSPLWPSLSSTVLRSDGTDSPAPGQFCDEASGANDCERTVTTGSVSSG
jgi:hypothetical protein